MNFTPSHVCFSRYQPGAVLSVAGEDAFSFLQGQFTQELRTSIEGPVSYGLWLNQKGKVLADSFVLRLDEHNWRIISVFSDAKTIRERLEAYIIADDVVVEDVTAEWAGVAILGDGVTEALRKLARALPVAGGFGTAAEAGWLFRGRRSAGESWEWLYPVSSVDPVESLRESGATEIDAVALERLRIEATISAVPRDVGSEDLPNEGGLDRDAISYTKGCYLGQEVMARLKSMGQVRRRLMQVAAVGDAPATLPAPLFAGAKKVGELRSVARTEEGFVGLAMISLLGLDGARPLSLAPDAPANVFLSSQGRA